MGDIIRTNARFTGSSAGEDWLSSFFWAPGTTGGSNTDATDTLARFRAFWFAMAGIIATGVSVGFDPIVLAYDETTGELSGAYTGSIPTSVSGSGGTDPLPFQTQGLVRWTSGSVINGRRVRGHTYVPAPCESFNGTSGQPSAGYLSGLQAGVVALQTAGSTASTPVIWHRPKNKTGGLGVPLTGGAPGPNWSVLRSRRG